MAIYKMSGDKKELVEIARTSFGEQGVLERADLQRLLRDKPDVLEKGLLIVSEEFGNWEDSNRRIDLLGLDAQGHLVVVELKRGDTGQHMDLQAIRYAAMVANMTLQQTVDTFQVYLEKRANEPGGEPVEEDSAETRLREHLDMAELENQVIHTEMPRIILVSENFGKELTTCVLWLNDSWLQGAGPEIKCIRLEPHWNVDEVLIETSVIVPLPEASDYRTVLGNRERETRSSNSARAQHISSGEPFNERIRLAQEQFQPGLRQLYDFALKLRESGLVQLSTFINGKGDFTKLNLLMPGKNLFLVSFSSHLYRGGTGEISFWPEWEGSAPVSFKRIGELIGPAKSSGVRHRKLSRLNSSDLDDILAVIDDAYNEANGRSSAEHDSVSFPISEN